MKLSIITINFKKPFLTLSCVASVYEKYRPFFEKGTFEFVIVDNASNDESFQIIKKEVKQKKYRNVSVYQNKKNNGFGGGNNFGVDHAKGETILFLNNDTIVKEGLDKMFSYFEENPEVGILGGPLMHGNGELQQSADSFYTLFHVFLLLLGMQRIHGDKNPAQIRKVDWVKGALLMIQKDLFQQLHGFDEHIFMYTEDMELCYRAKKIGKDTYFYPEVEVIHEDQGSSNRSFAIVSIYEGILYFYKKHKSKWELAIVRLLLQMKATLLVLYGKVTKNSYFVSTYEKALSVCR